jgi:UDP-GlcNAc3NAcA epimerase
VHRAENTEDPERLENIVEALCSMQNVVFPCHPRTRKLLEKLHLWDMAAKSLQVINPVGYLDVLLLEKNACKILTDFGRRAKRSLHAAEALHNYEG